MILAHIEKWGLDLQDCRGQGYDGASNMSGARGGVQAYNTLARNIQQQVKGLLQPQVLLKMGFNIDMNLYRAIVKFLTHTYDERSTKYLYFPSFEEVQIFPFFQCIIQVKKKESALRSVFPMPHSQVDKELQHQGGHHKFVCKQYKVRKPGPVVRITIGVKCFCGQWTRTIACHIKTPALVKQPGDKQKGCLGNPVPMPAFQKLHPVQWHVPSTFNNGSTPGPTWGRLQLSFLYCITVESTRGKTRRSKVSTLWLP